MKERGFEPLNTEYRLAHCQILHVRLPISPFRLNGAQAPYSNIYRGVHSTMEFFAVTRAAMDFTALLPTNAVHMAISGHPLAYARPGSV